MLTARAAKGRQSMLRGIVALGLGDGANRPRHGLVGDGQEAVRNLVRAEVLPRLLVDLVSQLL
jgi:hypothetical protein